MKVYSVELTEDNFLVEVDGCELVEEDCEDER